MTCSMTSMASSHPFPQRLPVWTRPYHCPTGTNAPFVKHNRMSQHALPALSCTTAALRHCAPESPLAQPQTGMQVHQNWRRASLDDHGRHQTRPGRRRRDFQAYFASNPPEAEAHIPFRYILGRNLTKAGTKASVEEGLRNFLEVDKLCASKPEVNDIAGDFIPGL